MKQNGSTKLFGWLYLDAYCKGMRMHGERVSERKEIQREYENVIRRAKDIGKSRMMSAYCMGAFFLAVNRVNPNVEENYTFFHDGLEASWLFQKALGSGESYLSAKKMAGRKKWEAASHQKKYENEWVVDVLEGNGTYDLGYNYWECGICKMCQQEGCLEIVPYLCELDYLLAEMMGMKLVRTQTLASGGTCCDFRYSRK